MLAHKGEDEGVMVAELIAGQKPHIDYDMHPLGDLHLARRSPGSARPSSSSRPRAREYKAGQFPFTANGRALGMGATDGFVKMLADARDRSRSSACTSSASIASDLIAEAVVAMEFKASAKTSARICHAHPSLSEVMREACSRGGQARAEHVSPALSMRKLCGRAPARADAAAVAWA